MSKYGNRETTCLPGEPVVTIVAGSGDCEYMRRVKACLEACAGMPDPASEIARLREIEKKWNESGGDE